MTATGIVWSACAAWLVTLARCPARRGAADKEHQQLMAEIRMLQEQQQQLQQMLGGLADTLKMMTTRLDEHAGANRKAFADQKLLVRRCRRTRARAAREGGRHQRPAVDDDAGAARRCGRRCVDAGATARQHRPGTASPAGTDPASAPATAPARHPRRARRRHLAARGCTTTRTPTTPPASTTSRSWLPGVHPHVPDVADKADDAQLYIGYCAYNAGK